MGLLSISHSLNIQFLLFFGARFVDFIIGFVLRGPIRALPYFAPIHVRLKPFLSVF
jgi:hypothetical protein